MKSILETFNASALKDKQRFAKIYFCIYVRISSALNLFCIRLGLYANDTMSDPQGEVEIRGKDGGFHAWLIVAASTFIFFLSGTICFIQGMYA